MDKVYRAKAKVQFGHFANSDLYMLTLDMSRISRISGTEVSGVLGFAMLSAMHLKIDYRDGLVDLHTTQSTKFWQTAYLEAGRKKSRS